MRWKFNRVSVGVGSFSSGFPYASQPLVMVDNDGNRFGAAGVSPAFGHQANTPQAKGGMDLDSLPRWLFRSEDGQLLRSAGTGRPMLKTPSELSPEQADQAAALRAMPLQPAQVYGIINALLIAGLLLWFSRLRWREGQVFLLMLILYPITRFILESIRGDNPHDLLRGRLTHNQYVSVGMVIVALILWRLLRRLPSSSGPSWSERLSAADTGTQTLRNKRKGRS